MPTFTTPRLLLTELSVRDAEAVYALYSHPDVLSLYAEPPILERAAAEDFVRRITANGNRVWSIRLSAEPSTIIGDCALHDWNEVEKSIEIGGSLLPDYWGRGIMREAFERLMAYAVEELGAKVIIGRTLVRNHQAIRLVTKLGFREMRREEGESILIFNTEDTK